MKGQTSQVRALEAADAARRREAQRAAERAQQKAAEKQRQERARRAADAKVQPDLALSAWREVFVTTLHPKSSK